MIVYWLPILAFVNFAIGYGMAIYLEPAGIRTFGTEPPEDWEGDDASGGVLNATGGASESSEKTNSDTAKSDLASRLIAEAGLQIGDVQDSSPKESEPASDQPVVSDAAGDHSPENADDQLADVTSAPEEWAERLKEAWHSSQVLVESAVLMHRLENKELCNDLRRVDIDLRSDVQQTGGASLGAFRDRLLERVSDFVQTQDQLLETLSNAGSPAPLEDQAGQLRTIVTEINKSLAASAEAAKQLPVDEPKQHVQAVTAFLHELIDQAFKSQGLLDNHLAVCLRRTDRLATIRQEKQFDIDSELHNRIGLESLLDQWWEENPERTKPTSVALLDFDGFTTINRELGVKAGDRILNSAATRLKTLVHSESRFDRVTRFTGQSFLILFGDSGIDTAASMLDELRRSIETTVFQLDDDHLELTVSGGVVEISADDASEVFVTKADQALQAAKAGGGNCSYAMQADGPSLVAASDKRIDAFTVRV